MSGSSNGNESPAGRMPSGIFGDDDSTELLLGVQGASTDVVIVQDPDLVTRYVGPSIHGLLGISGEELVARRHEVFHPDDRAPFATARERVLAGGDDERLRVRLEHADGSFRTFDVVISGRFDDPGLRGILIVGRDVTDLAATEQELARTRALYEALVVNSPEPTVALRADGTISFASPNLEAVFGIPLDQIVGTSGFAYVHPDDCDDLAAAFSRYLSGEEIPSPIARVGSARMGWRLIEFVASDATHVPGLGAYVLSLRDISERVHLEQRYDRMLRDATGTAVLVDRDGTITWTTHGFADYAGDVTTLEEAITRGVFEPSGDPRGVFTRVVEGGPGTTDRILGRIGPEGRAHRWVDIVLTNAFDDPAVEAIIVNIRDIDEAMRADQTGQRLSQVLQATSDLALIYDRDFNVTWANAAAVDLLGPVPMSREAILEVTPAWVQHLIADEALPALEDHGQWRGELSIATIAGDQIPIDATVHAHRDEHGRIEFISAVARDISERRALQDQLHAQARNDPLTGLPNRVLLMDRLQQVLATEGRSCALLFLDLDQFKEINDTQGHDAGDVLLVEAASRLRSALRPHDLVARFGGDEFVVLLPDVDDLALATERANLLLATFRGPIEIGALTVFVTASIGVAVSTGGDDAGDLVARADTAMYAAKASGRNKVAPFSDALRDRANHRLETARDLRLALEDAQLEVWYQPIVDAVRAVPVSVEALVRWRHPERGLLTPPDFIDVAEETGMILPLGLVVIEQVCDDLRRLGPAGRDLTVAVNLSARQLADPSLTTTIADLLHKHGISPSQLTVEITESTVMHDVTASTRAFDELRTLGATIAVDDFGTGYSSLAYLQRFPVQILKIDREFVAPLGQAGAWEHSLAAGIVSLGHSLGLQVIGEGVETPEQAEVLTRLGCDALQGFLYSPAVAGAELPALLHRLARRIRPAG